MPEFGAGEQKTAVVPMTNPTVKAFDYVAQLYMGTELTVMSEAPFHLEPGESKDVVMSVTMPSIAGTYPVYIGVFSGGESIALYKAEDVVVIAAVALFSVPAVMAVEITNGSILGMYWSCLFSCPITNVGSVPGTYIITWGHSYDGVTETIGSMALTLNPGETYFWSRSQWVDFRRTASLTGWLSGDWVGDNYSSVVAKL